MSQQKSRTRRVGPTGIKALIAAASVAATLVGWALLPSNDPPAAAATDPAGVQTQITVPGTTEQGSAPGLQAPATGDQGLPQVTMPNGFSQAPAPFTRSHSSR